MSQGNTKSVNRLTNDQIYHLRMWMEERRAHAATARSEELAAEATDSLSFNVSLNNVDSVRKAMGIAPVATADALARRLTVIEKQIAAILRRMDAPAELSDREPPAGGELFGSDDPAPGDS